MNGFVEAGYACEGTLRFHLCFINKQERPLVKKKKILKCLWFITQNYLVWVICKLYLGLIDQDESNSKPLPSIALSNISSSSERKNTYVGLRIWKFHIDSIADIVSVYVTLRVNVSVVYNRSMMQATNRNHVYN